MSEQWRPIEEGKTFISMTAMGSIGSFGNGSAGLRWQQKMKHEGTRERESGVGGRVCNAAREREGLLRGER